MILVLRKGGGRFSGDPQKLLCNLCTTPYNNIIFIFLACHKVVTCGTTRVAEVAREHGWHPPKSLDSDENFKPEHTLFCRELRFVTIYALFFGDLWA